MLFSTGLFLKTKLQITQYDFAAQSKTDVFKMFYVNTIKAFLWHNTVVK